MFRQNLTWVLVNQFHNSEGLLEAVTCIRVQNLQDLFTEDKGPLQLSCVKAKLHVRGNNNFRRTVIGQTLAAFEPVMAESNLPNFSSF